MSTRRTHIVIPEPLVTEIDRLVGKRRRSEFLTQAAEKELRRLQQIAQYLEGNWQEDLLFVLKQEQEAYQFCQQQMAACDRQLEQYFQGREDRSRCASLPEERRKARLKKKQGK